MQNRRMIYGYARVSTAAQDETGQVRQLKAAGCEKVFREKITGTTADRPQLASCGTVINRKIPAWKRAEYDQYSSASIVTSSTFPTP